MKVYKLILNSMLIQWIIKTYHWIKDKINKPTPWDSIDKSLRILISEQVRLAEENFIFKSILSVGIVYVTDMSDGTILYANEMAKAEFGKYIEGQVCYEVLQDRHSECDFCTNDIIAKQEGKPHFWVYSNKTTDTIYLIADIYGRLRANGNTTHTRFELAIPINSNIKKELLTAWEMKH